MDYYWSTAVDYWTAIVVSTSITRERVQKEEKEEENDKAEQKNKNKNMHAVSNIWSLIVYIMIPGSI